MRHPLSAGLALALLPTAALAQTPDSPPAGTEPAQTNWTAETYGGWARRDAASTTTSSAGTFALIGLTRQFDRDYVRGSFTAYRSTLHQSDAALPSTYLVGSLGAGANIDNWVFDGWASYGRQSYGAIATPFATRISPAAAGSPYVALGADFGRILTIKPGWYATPTIAATYAYTRLLRPGHDPDGSRDFQSVEPGATGVASLRVDHTFGTAGPQFVGLGLSYHLTNNGLSSLGVGIDPATGHPAVIHYADGWAEGSLNTSLRLTHRLWLDASATRSLGMRAGDTTTVSGGLHLKF